jgi:lipid A 3-O-deacylase
MQHARRLALLVLAWLAPQAGAAQPAQQATDPAAAWSFILENDTFSGTDRYYTNGFLFAWRSPSYDPPAWMDALTTRSRLFPDHGVTRWGLSFGQSIFTPDDTLARNPDPQDRPYAGWLYVSASLASYTATQYAAVELQAGVVGPSALGRGVQNTTHDLMNIDRAYGWDYQLRDEPGLNVIYNRLWRFNHETGQEGLQWGVVPSLNVSLGNVSTYASAGALLRLGNELNADFGPPRVRPANAGSLFFQPDGDWGWYVFAGAEGRAIARDIFLDGNTWRESRSVDRKPLVADLTAGFAVILPTARLTFSYTYRTKEFDTQRDAAQFGSVSIAFRF